MRKIFIQVLLFGGFKIVTFSQTTNTSPLPTGTTTIGNHLSAGYTNEVWSASTSLFFNYRGSAAATHFWNLGGNTGSSIMTLLNTGKVGIGTQTPLDKLHIHDGVLKLTGTNSQGGPMITFGGNTTNAPGGEWGIEYFGGINNAAGGLNFWKPSYSTGGFNNFILFLSNSQNVGINTNNPTAKLTVNGKCLIGDPSLVPLNGDYKLWVQTGILTEKVKVALRTGTDWSDYVFAKDYQLKTLPEVKTFITENKHLPGVPSAQQLVDEQGYDLLKMDAKLLEKIEELTLYVIQLSEENKELKERIITLEKGN